MRASSSHQHLLFRSFFSPEMEKPSERESEREKERRKNFFAYLSRKKSFPQRYKHFIA